MCAVWKATWQTQIFTNSIKSTNRIVRKVRQTELLCITPGLQKPESSESFIFFLGGGWGVGGGNDSFDCDKSMELQKSEHYHYPIMWIVKRCAFETRRFLVLGSVIGFS